MDRIYIENDNARIVRRDGDYRLDITLYSGVIFNNVEAHCLFPVTGNDRYISLLDTDRKEVAMIRDLNTLMPESQAAVREALDLYYRIPHITRIVKVHEKPAALCITADSDHGICYFEVRNRGQDIKLLFDGRVLIRDSNDNRYEIPDVSKLDRKSRDGLLI